MSKWKDPETKEAINTLLRKLKKQDAGIDWEALGKELLEGLETNRQMFKRIKKYFQGRKRIKATKAKTEFILSLINNDSFMSCLPDDLKENVAIEVLKINKLQRPPPHKAQDH